MYFKSFNKTLMNRLQSLLPEVQQITCSKVCNFLTLNLSDESGLLSHSGKIINNEHIYALAYLQSNFKNHIVNKSSISNIKKILQTIQNSEYEEIKQHFWGTQSRKSQAHRKNFYIFDKIDISQQLMKCSLMMNKNYNKILCFPNQNPFSISSSFEKFCLQYNVRALGLNEFSIRYLIKHISKVSKSSILLHEILSDDLSIFKEQKGIDSPRQLIIFMEKIKEKDRKGKKFLQLKQILKNFIKRQTFQAKLNIESKNFTITRLQHILDFQKYSQYMQLKQNIDKFKKRPSEVKTRNESHNHFTLFITQFLWLTKFIFDFNIQFSHTMDNKHQLLRKCKIAFECQNLSKYEVFILKDEIWTFPSASQSVILSSAAYILKIFPRLPHPKYFDAKPPNNRIDSEYPSCFLSLNPLFDEWVELITEALFEGNVFRVDQTLYLKLIVCKQFGNELKKNIDHQTYAKSQSIFSIFGLNQRKKEKRVAWINCSTSQLNRQTFHPNINAASILLGQIYNNEEYDMYNILKGNIPTVQQLLTYDALIIPGSGLSVLSKVQQIQQLSKVLLSAYQKSEKLKILGICYGHQLLAKIFGATVVKRARCHGLQLIKFNKQTLKKFSFLQPLFKYESGQLFLSQHHEDFVTTVPKQFLQLAVSKSCENQALVSKNGRIFSSQFHPEYMYPFTKAYVSRLNTFYNDEISQKPTFSHSKQKIQQHIRNCEDLRQCISMFL